jgi:hypothetical protein
MKYSELTNEAKENALNDYCKIFDVENHPIITAKVVEFFKAYDRDVFTENGLLKHARK